MLFYVCFTHSTIQVVQDLFTEYYWPVFIVSLIGTYVISCNIKSGCFRPLSPSEIKGHPMDIIMLACFVFPLVPPHG